MATRKEEREQLRQHRIAAEQRDRKAQRKWLVLGYAAAGLIGAAVTVGAVGAVLLIIGSSGGGPSGASHVNAPASRAPLAPKN
jgi:hypothetical protein